MPVNDKIAVDALINISKSLSKISEDISEIRKVITFDHRQTLRENRQKLKNQNSVLLQENKNVISSKTDAKPFTKEDALTKIHDILNGKYIN